MASRAGQVGTSGNRLVRTQVGTYGQVSMGGQVSTGGQVGTASHGSRASEAGMACRPGEQEDEGPGGRGEPLLGSLGRNAAGILRGCRQPGR